MKFQNINFPAKKIQMFVLRRPHVSDFKCMFTKHNNWEDTYVGENQTPNSNVFKVSLPLEKNCDSMYKKQNVSLNTPKSLNVSVLPGIFEGPCAA